MVMPIVRGACQQIWLCRRQHQWRGRRRGRQQRWWRYFIALWSLERKYNELPPRGRTHLHDYIISSIREINPYSHTRVERNFYDFCTHKICSLFLFFVFFQLHHHLLVRVIKFSSIANRLLLTAAAVSYSDIVGLWTKQNKYLFAD